MARAASFAREPGREAALRLGFDVEQIPAQLAHHREPADRTVAGHHGIDVHREDPVARAHPVRDRARPDDRVRVREYDVAGEHGAIGGQRARARRRACARPDLDQLHLLSRHLPQALAA